MRSLAQREELESLGLSKAHSQWLGCCCEPVVGTWLSHPFPYCWNGAVAWTGCGLPGPGWGQAL